MKTLHFNTGRKYQADGQRITATLHDDGVVTFMDHSRGVDGEFKLGRHCSFNEMEIMNWYDAGAAQGSQRSWMDGMQQEGCNSVYRG